MIHYHGTPITPLTVLASLAGRNFCVSFSAPSQVKRCHEIGQAVMLDNGAFSLWRTGKATNWPAYYKWVEPWFDYPTTWAVIPDIIDGSEADNEALLAQWPHGTRGAPVWHMHESIGRLQSLCWGWPRVCIGSSAQYATVGNAAWHRRMEQAMNAICGNGPAPIWLHMLRGMSLSGSDYPFASVDSTDIARNHARPHNNPKAMAERWDAMQTPACWTFREQMSLAAS